MMTYIKKHSKRIFVILFFLLTLMGTYGHLHYSIMNNKGFTILECFYYTLQLFTFKWEHLNGNIPFVLHLARFLCPTATWSGLFLGFKKPIEGALNEIFRWHTYRKIGELKGHVIICGLSKKAEILIQDIINNSESVKFLNLNLTKANIVVVETNAEHEKINNYIYKGVKVVIGSAADKEVLIKAGVLNAKYMIVLTDSDETNLSIAKSLTDIFTELYNKSDFNFDNTKDQLKAIIHLRDFYHLQAFKDYHIVRIPENGNPNTAIDFYSINIFQKAAIKVIDKYAPDKIIHSNLSVAKEAAEIIIIGLSDAGQNLLLQAAYMYHFKNLKKLKVTVIDNNIKDKLNKLIQFVPKLDNIIEIKQIEQVDFLESYLTISSEFKNVSVCYIAKDSDGENVFLAKKAKQIFYMTNHDYHYPKIVVLQPKDTKLLNLLDTIKQDTNDKRIGIDFFNLYDDVCTKKEIIEDLEDIDNLAKWCHYYYMLNNDKINNIKKDRNVDDEWASLSHGLKDSNRLTTRHLLYKLRFAGYELVKNEDKREECEIDIDTDTRNILAQTEHNRWRAEKFLNGFEYYYNPNMVKDEKFLKEKLKLHKDLSDTTWTDLDINTKNKDNTVLDNIKEIAAKTGKKIVAIL